MSQQSEIIYNLFKETGKRMLQFRWVIIILLIGLDMLSVLGVQKLHTDDKSWLMEDDPLNIATKEFEEIFGNSDFVGVLVEAEDVFAPDILRLLRELGNDLEEQVPFADGVVSLAEMEFTRGTDDGIEIGNIVPDEIPTDPADLEEIRRMAFSKEFLINRLFSDDSRQAWILLRLAAYPAEDKTKSPIQPKFLVGQTVYELIHQEKYRPYTLKTVGTPVFEYEKKLFYGPEAARLMKIALVVGVLMLVLFLRSFRGVLIPLITAISSILWVFGAMGHLDIAIDPTTVTIPIFLGMAVSIGYSIHLFTFFRRHFAQTGNRKDALVYAIGEAGWPIFFTAVTTISSMLSFYVVPVRQVRWMGLSAAAVTFATYLIVMTVTPALLSFGKNTPPRQHGLGAFDMWLERLLTRFSHWVQHHAMLIMIVSLGCVLLMLGGIQKVRVNMTPKNLGGLGVPYVKRMYEVGATKIGSINSYNVTVTFDTPGMAKEPEILQNLDALSEEIKGLPYVKQVSSLLDIIKDMNQVMHSDDPSYYRVPDNQDLVSQLLLLYELSNGSEQEHWVDYEYTVLRLKVNVSEYATAEINRQLRLIEQRTTELFPHARFGMIGGVVQTSVAQEYVSKGELVSFLIALTVIGILMMLVFRSITTGLIGMIPNIAPVIVVGGIMGYFDIPLEMTNMMIVPMLLGLAVDDTIHFITHCHLEFQRTNNYQHSIEKTFQSVGQSLVMTSFILIATFLVYGTSVARFFINLSILASSGILSALLADYFITPVLIQWTKPYGDGNSHSFHGSGFSLRNI